MLTKPFPSNGRFFSLCTSRFQSVCHGINTALQRKEEQRERGRETEIRKIKERDAERKYK
jgi:hypothetical protein